MADPGTESLVSALAAARPYLVIEGDPNDPDGAKVVLAAGPIQGQGRLRRVAEVYEGVIDVSIGPVAAHAYGRAIAEPPSLVLLFFANFEPALQLGLGFTLQGVGGLLAVDHIISTEAVLGGLRDGRIGALLFPDDPQAAAPEIMRTLADFFPPRGGGLAIGPALQLGWGGAKPLVTAKAMLLLAVPGPTIAMLGSIRVAIPSPAVPIIDLNADVYADVSAEHTLVLASLQRSRLAGIAIGGDFGILVGYGSSPSFALSAGGFHPRFRPPPELARMARISIDLSPGSVLTLRAEAYVALTDSAVMFGCRVELRAAVAGIGAEGQLVFDALLMWDPLHFEVDVDVRAALIVFDQTFVGIRLAMHLEGPTPWRANGRATLELPFFLPDIDFTIPTIEWGPRVASTPEVVSPRAIVVAALDDRGVWRAVPPASVDGIVTFRQEPRGETRVVVHPHGGAEVRQKAIPLGTDIARVGSARAAEKRVGLGPVQIEGVQVTASPVSDAFALGLFRDLTDDQKLSAPMVEQRPSGLRLSSPVGTRTSAPVERRYLWRTIFPGRGQASQTDGATFPDTIRGVLLHHGAAGRSPLRRPSAYEVPAAPIAFGSPAAGQE